MPTLLLPVLMAAGTEGWKTAICASAQEGASTGVLVKELKCRVRWWRQVAKEKPGDLTAQDYERERKRTDELLDSIGKKIRHWEEKAQKAPGK